MPSLVSNEEFQCFSQELINHFDTFKIKIIVNLKERRNIKVVNTNSIPGYSNGQNTTNVEFITVSREFWALVMSEDRQRNQDYGAIPLQNEQGITRIKVERDARDFLLSDKVINVEIPKYNKVFNIDGEEAPKNYFGNNGLVYYVFRLKSTK